MAYVKLQLKKVMKNTLTWLILGVVVLSIGLILVNYNASSNQTAIRVQVTQNLNHERQNQNQIQSLLARQPKDKAAQANLTRAREAIKSNQAILTALDHDKWQKAYRLMIKQNKQDIAQVKVGGADLKQDIKNKNVRLKALAQANVAEEDEQHPKQGYLFLFKLMAGVFPVLIALMLCFVLSNLFAAKYVDRLDKATLLPSRRVVILDLSLGLIVAGGLTLLVGLVSWSISSLFFGPGSLAYPIQGSILPQVQPQYRPLSDWIIPTLVLIALVVIFIVVLVLFLAQISRNQLICLFLALIIILGGAVLPFILQSMQKQTFSVRFLPMVYLFSAQVVTGQLGLNLQDVQLNFTLGCRVLVIAIVVLICLNLFWPKLLRQPNSKSRL